MQMVDYQIGPALMGGVVKEISEKGIVKINLNGRLGVIKVPKTMIVDDIEIEPGHELQFYFSYIQVVEHENDYDSSDMNPDYGITPTLIGGKFTQVNDTAIEAEIMDGMGTVAVPRRWVFTPVVLEEGQNCEFYFSLMKVTGKREIPFLKEAK
jgi:hypothetical protein